MLNYYSSIYVKLNIMQCLKAFNATSAPRTSAVGSCPQLLVTSCNRERMTNICVFMEVDKHSHIHMV